MAEYSEFSAKLCFERFASTLKQGKVRSYRPVLYLGRGLESAFH